MYSKIYSVIHHLIRWLIRHNALVFQLLAVFLWLIHCKHTAGLCVGSSYYIPPIVLRWVFWPLFLVNFFHAWPNSQSLPTLKRALIALLPLSVFHGVRILAYKPCIFHLSVAALIVTVTLVAARSLHSIRSRWIDLMLAAPFNESRENTFRKWLVLKNMRASLAWVIPIIMAIPALCTVFFYDKTVPKVITADMPAERYSKQYCIDICEFLKQAELLQAETWFAASLQDRLNILQLVANSAVSLLEAEPPRVEVMELEAVDDGYLLAEYVLPEKAIHLDYLCLMNMPDEAVRTLLHEARHSYQHQIIEWYEQNPDTLSPDLAQEAIAFRDSIQGYVSHKTATNYTDYLNQLIEQDAREFAEHKLSCYID